MPNAEDTPPSSCKTGPRSHVAALAGVAFALTAGISGLLVTLSEQYRHEAVHAAAKDMAERHLRLLDQSINQALSATYALAALVRQGRGQIDDFEGTARQFLLLYPGVSALQLSPDGIVTQSVPLKGNEKAIGHDLLKDPTRTKEAFLARDSGKLTLAGPFPLVQGGMAAIGRLPVYVPTNNGQQRFWGFTSSMIRFPDILDVAGLGRLSAAGYDYELWRLHPDTLQRQTIAASGKSPQSPVELRLAVPSGEWILGVAPAQGWNDRENLTVKLLLASFFTLLMTAVTAVLARQPQLLRAEVEKRTRQLQESESRFRTFFENNSSVMLLIDPANGAIVDANHAATSYYGYSRERIVGMYIREINTLPPEALAAEMARAKREKHAHFLFQHRLASGEIRHVEVYTTHIQDAGRILLLSIIHDITERKLAESRLQLAASVFSHAREGIVITDANARIVDANQTFSQISGYSREEVLGKNPNILSSGRQGPEFYANMWQQLLHDGYWYGEIWNRRKNGEVYVEMLTISAVRDEQGETRHYVALFSDITAIKQHEQQLEHIAHYDALTGLPNRVLLADRLNQALLHTQRRGNRLAVAYLDLDGFKAINDTHGHEVGDDLLIAVAEHMKDALREGDTIARLGGDEFVAVLVDLDSVSDCEPILGRLLAATAEPKNIRGLLLGVSASIGVTFYPQGDEVEADQILRQADQAMYQAKLEGKNHYHIFDAERDRNVKGQRENLDRIQQALQQGELVLHYQPKVNMRSGEIIGAEALIRWQHPERGLLPPAAFLPVVEDQPLSVDIGEWVIETALRQVETWKAAGLNIPVSVNVSARHLQQADFMSRLREILASHPAIPLGALELEVLETSALADIAQVSQVIAACGDIGVSFALDDFGTGYSSLTYLKRLPATLLKIDQSFVRDMLDDPDDLAILKGVLGLAAAFRRQAIAEGVETQAHGELLLLLGCELAQGYGIARPMPGERLIEWAQEWHPYPAWENLNPVSRDDLPLLFAGVEHRAWIRAIEACLRGERLEHPPLDVRQCHLGIWHDGEARLRYGDNPLFQAIAPLHQAIHALAQTLLDLQVQGRTQDALDRIPELYALRDQMITRMRELIACN